jgi:hypothetical protein
MATWYSKNPADDAVGYVDWPRETPDAGVQAA